MSLWAVSYAWRSEAADFMIVRAPNEGVAIARVLQRIPDEDRRYAKHCFEAEWRYKVERVRDGLHMIQDAEH